MQAIITKYIGATNTKSARVKAIAQAGSLTLSWDDELGIDDNHFEVAKAFAEKFGWLKNGLCLVGGGMPDGTGNCYVLVDSHSFAVAQKKSKP